ncbi:MAG: FAD-dependent monooxygenase [Thiobacillus sp.]|nr:FAD-dependent monooxygenase [Thiobacillus sp.]
MSTERYQVVVVGAGLVGAAAALALGRQGLRVALIERQAPTAPQEKWDTRVYAIGPPSQRFLAQIGAWDRMERERIQPVFRMDVAGDVRGAVRLDAYESGVPQLATIVENGRLQNALWRALEADGNVALHCPAAIAVLSTSGSHTSLQLDDGSTLETELVVGADGAHSSIRAWAGLASVTTPYDRHGVVANFECERPHRGTAFQWFFDGDALAWLPLSAGTRSTGVQTVRNCLSIVWSTRPDHAKSLLALDASAFADTVQRAGRHQLGRLQLLTPAAAFPLQLQRVLSSVAPGVVLIGDAAHGVHPLAGQGVNLGFGDAEVLVDVLAAQHRRTPCGDVRLLKAYARQRAEPVMKMQALTHGLHHLFADARAGWLRNMGMQCVDRLPPLKAALVREAMS